MPRFKFIWNWIHLRFRACPICGTIHEMNFILCETCWPALLSSSLPSMVNLPKVAAEVFYLWSWKKDQNRHLSILITALKRHPIESDWDIIAAELSKQAIANNKVPTTPFVFIPCPSSRKRGVDHAAMLAFALGRYWQVPVLEILEKEGAKGNTQKSKEIWERAMVQIRTIEKSTKLIPEGHNIILIDDILTTGATANASINALGQTNSYQVWCLAHRRLAASR